MKLFLAPHNDDEALFGAFTLLREHPLVAVVTDSWIQFNRGENITADYRWQETINATSIFGCVAIRLGIRDDVIDEYMVKHELSKFAGFSTIYAPAVQGGNPHHDLIGRVAQEIFGDKLVQYTTYSKESLYTTGITEVSAPPEAHALKERALNCYKSQINLPATAPHFLAVKGKSEWYI